MAGCPGGEGEGDEAAGGWSALVRQAEAVEWVTSTTLPRPAPLSRTVDYFPQDSFPPATILSISKRRLVSVVVGMLVTMACESQ